MSTRPFAGELPGGSRVYAVGDIHGEYDLFDALLAQIEQDSSRRGAARVTIIVLGDFVDRGPNSAKLLALFRATTNPRIVVLKGNHEACLVAAYRGNKEALRFWLRFGGVATLRSLGAVIDDDDIDDRACMMDILDSVIDEDTIEWLDRLPTSHQIGSYFFTHAGVRPGVSLSKQSPEDLLWIRQPFLASERNHGAVIVHGHTIDAGEVRLGGNRIGVDTGAHEHGRLTALGLEGRDQWTVEVLRPPSSDELLLTKVQDYRPLSNLGGAGSVNAYRPLSQRLQRSSWSAPLNPLRS